jgi:hypothetical protein
VGIDNDEIDVVLVSIAARVRIDLMPLFPVRLAIDWVWLNRDNAPANRSIECADREEVRPGGTHIDEDPTSVGT